MEQRIGPNIQPLQGAAVDPAFVPGITGPRPAEPKDAEPRETEPDTASAESAEDSADSASKAASKAPEEEPETETSAKKPHDEEASDEASEDSEEAPDAADAADEGPVFDASDRRARIVADRAGVRLTLDDQEAEFRWDEIGAVETEVPRFGKRFTITVHTPDRRWYPIEIEATARSRFKEWETSLDEVLDTYFEDGEDAEAEDAEAEEAEAEAEESAP
ncbi:hypothetical protein ACFFS2_27325 [Streptomyces aurantiacus]|uniref:Uncharacterized protein n=1 Tax=Streptomyces aurantiacus TaxID=47760 RepID=A0A7G1P4N6_9ACTN|nr:hypothetical protein [Streptomyces aurantiacus]BCL28035.1 hypothetical protein GCM10017557_28940 [Streptomyces aurantiacus]